MRLLVTGGGGQLASELATQSKHETTVLTIEQLDITSKEQIAEAFSRFKPDAVINSAALTNVDFCELNPSVSLTVNAEGPKYLAEACARHNAKFLHVSTDYVFDGTKRTPYVETDATNPQSVYGEHKRLAEQYVTAACKKSFVVRTAWLYGYVGKNFVKTILNVAKQGQPLKVVNDQVGNPTNAVDLAKHILKLIDTENYGIYHCTNNGECSWYDFSCEFLRLSGLKYTIEPCDTSGFPRPAKRPAHSSLDNKRLRQTIGDEMRPWQDAIADYMKHYDKETGEINA